MRSSKRYIVTLSLASFVASLLIGLLVYLLVKSEGPFSITANPVNGIKICITAGCVHCLLNLILFYVYAPNSFESGFRIVNVAKCCCLLVFACFTFHAIAVCFGAPLVKSATETFHFAMLLTVLVCLPFCLLSGPSIESWFEVFIEKSSHIGLETVVYFTSMGALLGSWLGAIPIPLDWDRPWQEWPISCVVGAVGGYSLGLLLSAVYLPRKYSMLHKSKFF
ncbi:hypothetical protein BsWGS_10194 [Bradybaena similaris]